MGSKSIRVGDSPSRSTSILPQLRTSRRGSLASLSSTAQLDKDVLAQALDEIHTTASQSETLTTFNEYTSPPSSSSGTDSKGIASELQGGLSGLYTRLRASVGNVKDIVNIGGDNALEEASFARSPKRAINSTAASEKGRADSSRITVSTVPNEHQVSALKSERQSPLSPQFSASIANDRGGSLKQSRTSAGSASASSKSLAGSFVALKSLPATLTQTSQPTTIHPALAEVNVSAVQQQDLVALHGLDVNGKGVAANLHLVREIPSKRVHDDTIRDENANHSDHDLIEEKSPQRQGEDTAVNLSNQPTKSFQDCQRDQGQPSGEDSIAASQVATSSIVEAENIIGNASNGNEASTRSPSTVAIDTNARIDVLRYTENLSEIESNDGTTLEGSYQHLELPLTRSLAPSQATTSRDSRLHYGGSRASSLETDAESLPESASRHLAYTLQTEANPAHSMLSVGTRKGNRKTMNVPSRLKNKVLNKEYWMKDENAKDCFYCSDAFSTFRRKHHCRTCGQIFDSKCTSLISGERFGQPGSLRVCKPCEAIINGDDESSEFSDDGTLSMRGLRPRHGSAGASDIFAATPVPNLSLTNAKSAHRKSRHPDLSLPKISIPATRKAGGDSGRKPTVLEIEAERTLARPSSSRSLKSTFGGKSNHTTHRRHNSRHALQRGFRPAYEDSAPFHQSPVDDRRKLRPLPAFHDDNIIDPDLAPYLSDEDSSEDEQMSIMAALNGSDLSRSHDNDRHGFSGLLASSKQARSRVGDISVNGVTFASQDGDTHSLGSFKTGNIARLSKRRNLSVSGNTHLRPSPRAYRASPAIPNFGMNLHESISGYGLTQDLSSASPVAGLRMIRSSSMRGASAPAIELNHASLNHVRKLLRQLLGDSKVSNVASWEKALIPILLRATDDVNPDVQNGDGIDIRHYVKLKKIPGGRPGDTSYVSGLVFSKNLALKCMPRSITHPNILILTFPLEYARHQLHFMSLEPVIRQEREFLQNLVNRIAALRPQLLLVERNVSGLALEFLQQANIATAYNVKASVLEAVSRCCQTKIISSIDKLAIKPAQVGKCASFQLRTYINGGRKKTYMFLSGCAKELGCTIVLRGDDDVTLASMKRITEFMVYVVYNLKLETCLMRDEFASMPLDASVETPFLRKDIPLRSFQGLLEPKDPRRHGVINSHLLEQSETSVGTVSNHPNVSNSQASQYSEADKSKPSLSREDSVPDDIPMPTFYGDMVEEHQTKILSASPFVKFVQPYLLMRAREQERRLAYLRRLRDQDIVGEKVLDEKSKPQKFDLIRPEMVHEKIHTASKKLREVLHAVHDAEYDKALHSYQTQSKQWETYISASINLFDPYAHQNIAVLYSLVCTATTVPCSGPDILAFDFYNENEADVDFEADCTLGQYVEDLCLGARTVCTANGCERKMFEHHRQYVHGEAQLSCFIEQYPCKLRGLQDVILMWSTCRKCDKETQVLPMSDSTWKYSFGKYLELSFWSSELHARADVCPHDLHRDHLRYFGFKNMALRVHYDPITLVEIIVPRARITWKVDNDLLFRNDLFTKIENRLSKFMLSVKARIKSINTDSVLPEKAEICGQEMERLSKRAHEEHLALIQQLRDKYMNSKHYEIIPLNQAVRAVQEKAAEWDNAFAEFDQNFFPSEKDIRRLAALQLKKIFLDRDDSVATLTPIIDDTSDITPETVLSEKTLMSDTHTLTPQTRRMSPEKAHDMLAAVVERHVSTDGRPDQHQSAPATSVPSVEIGSAVTFTDKQEERDIGHPDHGITHHSRGNSQERHGKILTIIQDESPGAKAKQSEKMLRKFGDSAMTESERKPAVQRGTGEAHASGIPRPIDVDQRRTRTNVMPTLSRTQSQPMHLEIESSTSDSGQLPSAISPTPIAVGQLAEVGNNSVAVPTNSKKPGERKSSDRVGFSAPKPAGVSAHSMIPRSIASRRKDSKVSNLAKHFEQLSREFEKERIRERRQRAAKSRQARVYPMSASKPIVHIYRNVDEAVEEKEPSDEYLLSSDPAAQHEGSLNTINHMANSTPSQTPGDDGFHVEETTAENTETDDNNAESNVGSDVEGEGTHNDQDRSVLEDIQVPEDVDEHHPFSPEEAQLDIRLDLPKHEKSSLMKMLTNFWAERSASGWQPLEYPLNATDHIFADSDIIVREDEPCSLIAFALGSEDYQEKLQSIINTSGTPVNSDDNAKPTLPRSDPEEAELEESLLRPTGKHLKYQFTEGSAKMLCKVFYAEQFDALRRKCGVSERFVESLSRCMKWDSKGGKTKSVFLKTLDDRFVLKSLSPIETQAFLQFAPGYFYVMSRFLFHDMPSVIAKMLGFFQITIKNPITGVDFNWSLLVMENLFYDRSPNRTFDLKGSMRNRRIQSTGEQNEVLLDENMVDFIYATPLFSREHSKRLLRASVFNDTLFLAKQNVMDYSLMVAIDEDRKELVVGIIDCIRTYTWDKKLETWIKDRGKNRPTVTSPKEYKSRFREAMSRYVLQAPNCWHQFKPQPTDTRSFRTDEPAEDREVQVHGL